MKRRLCAALICVCMIIMLLPTLVFAVETSGTTGDCTWKLSGTVLTISGTGTMGNYNNTSNLSPWGKTITDVVIENGVTSIGDYAFYFCTALKSLTIPNSIKSFGDRAFYYCYSLPGIVIPDGTTLIGDSAFYKCAKINEITIPNSVKTIGEEAFSLCSFKSIVIPDSVTSIGVGAFSYNNSLTSIKVDENNQTYYSNGNCIIKKSTKGLIAGCGTSVIPDGVVSIEKYALKGMSLSNIALPDSVTKIGDWAFAGSDVLSISLPESITSVGYGAFYLCSSLKEVYYSGNKTERAKIQVAGSNTELADAKWYYAPCENDAHFYDYTCSTICNICEYERTAETTHRYDNNCDDQCNVCSEYRISKHAYVKNGENAATCSVCGISKTFDFIITTDETITLSYESTRAFDFAIGDITIANKGNTSSSIISSGSYYRQSSSVKVLPVFPGETVVQVVADGGTIITSSTLLVVEGNHQLELVKILKEPTYTEPGTELYKCKFCDYEEERSVDMLLDGNVDGVDGVNVDDAIYLLQYVLMPEMFPISRPVDFDGNGLVDVDDAIYLLQHVLMPELFPLQPSLPPTTEPMSDVLIISDTQTISNQTIDTDVYITSTGIATFNNVTVNGNIYCYGQLKCSSCTANNVYAYAYGSMMSCGAFDGIHGKVSGGISCNKMTILDNALDYAFNKWGKR